MSRESQMNQSEDCFILPFHWHD